MSKKDVWLFSGHLFQHLTKTLKLHLLDILLSGKSLKTTSCLEGLKEMYAWFHYDVKKHCCPLIKSNIFDTVSLKLFVLFVRLLCVIFIVSADPYSACFKIPS